jgi:hypothetical protein
VYSVSEGLAIDVVAIAEKIGRRGVVREGVHDLLGRPVRGGVFGDVEVDDAPAMVSEHDEDEEHPEARGWDREDRSPGPPSTPSRPWPARPREGDPSGVAWAA